MIMAWRELLGTCQLNIATLTQNKALAFMVCGTCPVNIVDLCKLHDIKNSNNVRCLNAHDHIYIYQYRYILNDSFCVD
jgi:hypothetical protein